MDVFEDLTNPCAERIDVSQIRLLLPVIITQRHCLADWERDAADPAWARAFDRLARQARFWAATTSALLG